MSYEYPYRYRELLTDSGIIEHIYSSSGAYNERPAGIHNRLWAAIARDEADFRDQHHDQLMAVAEAMRADGFVAGTQVADALLQNAGKEAYHAFAVPGLERQLGMVSSCSDVEYDFAYINAPKPHLFGGFVLLTTDMEEPLLLEKNAIGLSSQALSLQEIVVDNVPYPAGFIFGVIHHTSTFVRAGALPNGQQIVSAHISQVGRLQPRRLSQWAIPENERSTIFADMYAMQGASDGGSYYNTKSWGMQGFGTLLDQVQISDVAGYIATRALRNWQLDALAPAA